jgi:hypothetical protein
MNSPVREKFNPLQLTSFIFLIRFTIFAVSVVICAGTSVRAQLGTNPFGSTITLGPSDSFNGNTSGDGYVNYGNATVIGAEFSQNTYNIGLYNASGSTAKIGDGAFDSNYFGLYNYFSTVSISGGNFDNNYYDGVVDSGSTDSISGGTFDNNAEGLTEYYSTDSISGGDFDNDGDGLYNYGSTDSISGGDFENNTNGLASKFSTDSIAGGTFDNNIYGLYSESSTDSIYGGNLQDNSGYDLYTDDGGTINVYGESFGGLPFGDLPEYSTGSLEWTLSNGTTEDLTYYNGGSLDPGGTIDLIYVPVTAPAPEACSLAVYAGLALAFGALVMRARRKRSVTDLVD